MTPHAGSDACLACGARADHVVADDGQRFRVLVCRACGLGRTVPQPSDDELLRLYEGDYAGASARKFGGLVEWGRRGFARAFARRIARRLGKRGRVLDIGCGDGKVLAALAARGFDCTGTELARRAGEALQPGVAIAVRTGALDDARFPEETFDVVVLRHVLEHLRDPVATLTEVRRILASHGTLVIAVPNRASWQARAAGIHWFHLDLPRHLHHFTPSALRAVLEKTGFRVERTSHFSLEQNPYGWLQSAFNAAGGRWRAFYDRLRAPGAAGARAMDPLAFLVALGALPLSVALATVESAAGRGGTFEVWARPTTAP